MADTVNTNTFYSSQNRLFIQIQNISDGTGESAVIKVDKSTLTNQLGAEPSKLAIEAVQYSIQGFTSVRLYWDHTTDDEALVLPTGAGFKPFNLYEGQYLIDPGSAGGTGDLILTTAGNVSGATYDIILWLRLVG